MPDMENKACITAEAKTSAPGNRHYDYAIHHLQISLINAARITYTITISSALHPLAARLDSRNNSESCVMLELKHGQEIRCVARGCGALEAWYIHGSFPWEFPPAPGLIQMLY